MKKIFKVLMICSLCFSIVGCNKKNIAENQDEANKIIEAAYRIDKKGCMEPWDSYSVYETMKSAYWFFICNDAHIDVVIKYNAINDTNDITDIVYHGKDYKVQAAIYGDIKDKDEKSTNDLNDWLTDTGITKEQLIEWIETTLEKEFDKAEKEMMDE